MSFFINNVKNYRSAKDYGATGNGVTDDTTALQAWLDAGGGFLPSGVYLVTSSLTISKNGTQLLGEGVWKSSTAICSNLRWNGAANGTLLKVSGTTTLYSILITRVAFDNGTNASAPIDGVTCLNVTYMAEGSRVENCRFDIYGNNTRGIYGAGNAGGASPYYMEFVQNDIAMNNIGGVTTGSVGLYFDRYAVANSHYQGPNANRISGGRISGGDKGIWIRAGGGNSIYGVDIESTTTTGTSIELGDATADWTGEVSSYNNAITSSTARNTGGGALSPAFVANEWLNGAVKIGSSQYQRVLSNTTSAVATLVSWNTIPATADVMSLWYNSTSLTTILAGRGESAGIGTYLKINPGAVDTCVQGGDIGSVATMVSQLVGDAGDRINPNSWRDYSPIAFSFTFASATPADLADQNMNVCGGVRNVFIPGGWQVLGACVKTDSNVTGGSVTFKVVDNGSAKSGSDIILSSANTINAQGGGSCQLMFPPGTVKSTGRGRYLGLQYTTASFTTSATATAHVLLFVQLMG